MKHPDTPSAKENVPPVDADSCRTWSRPTRLVAGSLTLAMLVAASGQNDSNALAQEELGSAAQYGMNVAG